VLPRLLPVSSQELSSFLGAVLLAAVGGDALPSQNNCALYDYQGTRDGVERTNQDSYYCQHSPLCEPPPVGAPVGTGGVCPSSDASFTTWASSTAGTSDLGPGGGIGSYTSSCYWPFCKADSGKCCLRQDIGRNGGWCPWTCY